MNDVLPPLLQKLTNPWPVMPWMIALGVILCAAIAMIVFGSGQRRRGTDPHCRKCKFNLTGLPVGHPRCPECGADLSKPKSRRVGYRSSRRSVFLCGVLLTVIVLSLGGVQWYRVLQTDEGQRYRPISWVAADLGSTDQRIFMRAMTELTRRCNDHELSDKQKRYLLNYPTINLMKMTFPMFASARSAFELRRDGKLSDVDWDAFCRRLPHPELKVQKWPLSAPWLSISIDGPQTLGVNGYRFTSRVEISNVQLNESLSRCDVTCKMRTDISGLLERIGGSSAEIPATVRRNLSLGEVKVRAEATWELVISANDAKDDVKLNWKGSIPIETSFENTAGDPEPVIPVTDEMLRDAVRAALCPKISTLSGRLSIGQPRIFSPVRQVFRLVARNVAGVELPLEPHRLQLDPRGGSDLVSYQSLPPGKYDLIIRPDIKRAVELRDCDQIWGLEEVFPGMIVVPEKAN